ncbi:MAG TPA: hypothetical protein DEF64_02930 [Ruminococcaceae bacterium]|nr:hypothetical protein [Oscillospiraceae bacterium]
MRILQKKIKDLNTTLTSQIHTEQNNQEKFLYGKCQKNIKAMLQKLLRMLSAHQSIQTILGL